VAGDGKGDRVSKKNAVSNRDEAPAQCVRISVRDTGCGMDAATLARVFEPFFDKGTCFTVYLSVIADDDAETAE
jgi:signal transduction histidine kinase